MSVTATEVRHALEQVDLPQGGSLISKDMLRALRVDADGAVSFVIEAPSPEVAQTLDPVRVRAEAALLVRRRRPGRSRWRASTGSSPSPLARAGWESPRYPRTLPWRWRNRAGGSACWMPISTVQASRA